MPRTQTGRRKFDGRTYSLYDAYPTKSGAKNSAKDFREVGNGKARTVDMGPGAGRLRYGVYVIEQHRKPKKRRR